MSQDQSTAITVEVTIDSPVEKVWQYFNDPQHIQNWCAASDDWHAPSAESDFRVGGNAKTRMEAKDGSFGFDFEYEFTEIIPHQKIVYRMPDGRMVTNIFENQADGVRLIQTFDTESQNPVEMQREGWLSILNNFKSYVESH